MIIELLEIYITKTKKWYVVDGIELPFSIISGSTIRKVIIREVI